MELNYIDTSFLVPFYLPEPSSEKVESKLLSLPVGSLIISPLVQAEFASLLSRKCRVKEIKKSDAREIMEVFDSHLKEGAFVLVAISVEDFDRAIHWMMSFKYNLKAPDAIHLAVAFRKKAAFLTLDTTLAEVAKKIGIKVKA